MPSAHALHSEFSIQEVENGGGNFHRVRFKREVACVVEMYFRIRVIASECLGAVREEEWIVLAPEIQQRWEESSRARRTLELDRELRERLRKEVLAWEVGAAVHRSTTDELNRLMAVHPMRTRLKTTRNGVAMERWFETGHPEDLLAPPADSAGRVIRRGPS